jgi:NADH-quinone oxidoreductase subunit G
MCDDGRLGYHYVNSKERILRPLVKKEAGQTPVPYAEALTAIRTSLSAAAKKDGAAVSKAANDLGDVCTACHSKYKKQSGD